MGGCLVTKSEEQFRISYSVFQHIAHSNKIIFFTIITGCRGGGDCDLFVEGGDFFRTQFSKTKSHVFL